MTKAGEELIKAATEALEITHGQAEVVGYFEKVRGDLFNQLIHPSLISKFQIDISVLPSYHRGVHVCVGARLVGVTSILSLPTLEVRHEPF